MIRRHGRWSKLYLLPPTSPQVYRAFPPRPSSLPAARSPVRITPRDPTPGRWPPTSVMPPSVPANHLFIDESEVKREYEGTGERKNERHSPGGGYCTCGLLLSRDPAWGPS